VEVVRAGDVVLATGGAGQCFAVTTNPALSTGDGIALALAAGVACADVEFVQFHPTALHHPSMPRPLLSEALRGEGAVLRDEHGSPVMAGVHPLGDLAPRDVVARACYERMHSVGGDHVWLDATMIDDFAERFPTIWSACRSVDLDPRVDMLPVAPAAHYMSGGVVTDLDGASTLPHLWACGETACSGVHGANRLASNSLLDGLVFGHRVIESIAAGKERAASTGAMTGVLDVDIDRVETVSDDEEPPADKQIPANTLRGSIQQVMSANCGVVRDAAGLENAAGTLHDLARLAAGLPAVDVGSHEVSNLVGVSSAIVSSATRRTESRGSHTRRDHPQTDDEFLGRLVVLSNASPVFVPLSAVAVGGHQ
jgi:L-aspartate oxidase